MELSRKLETNYNIPQQNGTRCLNHLLYTLPGPQKKVSRFPIQQSNRF